MGLLAVASMAPQWTRARQIRRLRTYLGRLQPRRGRLPGGNPRGGFRGEVGGGGGVGREGCRRRCRWLGWGLQG